MHKILIGVAAALLFQASPAVAQKTEVMAVIKQFIDGFNKGDINSALATCAEQTSIIDEFAPYEWHGTGSCARWAADFDADAKKRGITDGVVTIATPRHFAADGDRAYAVYPATYEYKLNGKPVKQSGATLTVALQKTAPGWRITGWTWSTN
jgi:ketosteroid isomerase-like protein